MYRLTYDGNAVFFYWTGTYEVMRDKQETLIHAFDYDPDCFTLVKIGD